MATIALALACTGTALGAATLTGARVADRSLTGNDVKGSSLGVADLSAAARATLVGPRGDQGFAGARGSSGAMGDRGPQGARGSAAFMTSAFAYRETGLVKNRFGYLPPNDNGGTGTHWDSPAYATADPDGMGPVPQISTSGHQQINLTSSYQPVVSLTGMVGADPTKSPDTRLRLTFSEAWLNATASVSLLHRSLGDDFATSGANEGTPIHGRVQCALFYGTSADPNLLTDQAGVAVLASAGYDAITHELINVAVNGSAPTPGTPAPGTYLTPGVEYNVTVKCRDADYTGTTQWQVASGNLTALASR